MVRRTGKRVEVFEVSSKLRSISVEIRLEKSGMFYSEFAGERLENTDLEALREALRGLVRAHEGSSFKFHAFIEYRLVEDKKAAVGLEFRVIELSDAEPGKPRLVRPAREQLDLDAPQYPFSFVETRRYFPKSGTRVVPYTAERLRVLEEVAGAIRRLRERLHEYLDVPDDVIGDALDWLHTTRLASYLLPVSDPSSSFTNES